MRAYSFFYGDISTKEIDEKIQQLFPIIISNILSKFAKTTEVEFVERDGLKHAISKFNPAPIFTCQNGIMTSSLLHYKVNSLNGDISNNDILNRHLYPFIAEFNHLELYMHPILLQYANILSFAYPRNFNILLPGDNIKNNIHSIVNIKLEMDEIESEIFNSDFNVIRKDFIDYNEFCHHLNVQPMLFR